MLLSNPLIESLPSLNKCGMISVNRFTMKIITGNQIWPEIQY